MAGRVTVSVTVHSEDYNESYKRCELEKFTAGIQTFYGRAISGQIVQSCTARHRERP